MSPPFFEEIAAHKKHMFFVLIIVFAFAFFLFFHISVDFRVPLADALGQIRFILDRFWCHFWIKFPCFPPPAPNSCRDFARNFSRNWQRTIEKVTRNAKNLQRTSNKLLQTTFPQAKSQAAYSIFRRDFCYKSCLFNAASP